MTKTNRKLSLGRETLKRLTPGALDGVGSGSVVQSAVCPTRVAGCVPATFACSGICGSVAATGCGGCNFTTF